MKNIILQHWTGTLGPLELASKANMEKYAKQCGAEYELILGNQFHPKLHGCYQKLIMLICIVILIRIETLEAACLDTI